MEAFSSFLWLAWNYLASPWSNSNGSDNVDSLNRVRLPPELYPEILQHLSKRELIPVLAASQDLRLEAIRLYYADVVLPFDERRLLERFSKFCSPVGPLIKTLVLKDIRCDNQHIHPILISAPNLQSLTLTWGFDDLLPVYDPFFPRQAPFQLRTLDVANRKACQSLISFVKSQSTSLTRLHIYSDDLDFGIPRLRVLGSSAEQLSSIMKSAPEIRCFDMMDSRPNTMFSAPSVRAVRLGYAYADLSYLSTLFPKLQFLCIAGDNHCERSLDLLPSFASIQKVVICLSPKKGAVTDADLDKRARRWFSNNPRLEVLNMFVNGQTRSFERAQGRPCFICRWGIDQWDEEEWLRYQDDDYDPRKS